MLSTHVPVDMVSVAEHEPNIRKIVQSNTSAVATHALISFAASGYTCMASLRWLRVTICEVVKYNSWIPLRFQLKGLSPSFFSISLKRATLDEILPMFLIGWCRGREVDQTSASS